MTSHKKEKPSLGVSSMASTYEKTSASGPIKRNQGFGLKNPLNYVYVIIYVCLFLTLVSNIAFWRHILQINEEQGLSFSFMAVLPVILVLLLSLIFMILFSYRYVLKIAISFIFITCAMCTYVAWSYRVVFNYDMMVNIYETNIAEASSYLSLKGVILFIVLGVIPTALLWRAKIYFPPFFKSLFLRIGAIIILFAAAGGLVLANYQNLSFVGRNNSKIQAEILPTSYIYYTVSYVREKYLTKPNPPVVLGADAKINSTSEKPRLVFLVVGETARAKNYGALGYERDTNPYTAKENVINYHNVSSCGTATAISVPCMFSNMTREGYAKSKLKNRDNLLDVVKKTDTNIFWFDNDGGCKQVCDRVPKLDIEPKDPKYCSNGTCQDEVLLKHAQDFINNAKGKASNLAIFHIIGSHGPRYFERYPKSFAKFTPTCDRADVENCNFKELSNTYDNTILYTDYVISQFIDLLKKYENEYDVALLYLSDHGESLGENGLYLHGTPYSFAPSEQTHVPMQLWLPDETAQNLKLDKKCLTDEAKDKAFSHDNLFHSVLGLLQIDTKDKNPKLDLFNDCIAK